MLKIIETTIETEAKMKKHIRSALLRWAERGLEIDKRIYTYIKRKHDSI